MHDSKGNTTQRGEMRKRFLVAAIGPLPAALVLVGTAGMGASANTGHTTTRTVFSATLTPVPTNHVHASGRARVQLRGDTARVTVKVKGLIMAPHAMHIHFRGEGECPQVGDGNRG